MARYGQYGNFYDPVGSHANQPSGYTFQTNPSTATYPSSNATAGYGATYTNYGSNAYGTQQYDASQQQKSSSDMMASGSHNSSLFRVDGNSTGYGAGGLVPQQARMQNNSSPLHANRQASIGAVAGTQSSYPSHDQAGFNNPAHYRDNRTGASSSDQSFRGSYTQQPQQQQQQQQQPQPPQRYQSPIHALQASQHQRQSSRGSTQQPSPQLANAGRSAQPNTQQQNTAASNVTVNPSHVYDNRAELHRQAMYDAERRKKREAEQAAKKAEEERAAAEEAERQRLLEEQRKAEEERQNAEAAKQQKAEQDAAKKKEAQKQKNEQRRKAREEKKRSNTAATALQQLSSSSFDPSTSASNVDENDEEQMRALFKRMREFNAKNPAMLAKLWEEERTTHAQGQSPSPSVPPAASTPAKGKGTKQAKQVAATAKAAAAPKQAAPPTINTSIEQPAAAVNRPAVASPATQLSQAQSTKATTGAQAGQTAQYGSIWPNHNKGLIAEAAGKWLCAQTANAGKSISKEAILEMLNSGPSYVQLCGILEGRGWRFDRTKFARELLKASPDLSKFGNSKGAGSAVEIANAGAAAGSNSNGPSQKTNGGSISQSQPGNSTTPTIPAVSPAPGVQHVSQGPSLPDTLNAGTAGASQNRQASQSSQPPEVKPDVVSHASPPRPPADKEEAARKRTFNDLVDLTAQDSDEEDAPPPPKSFKPSVNNAFEDAWRAYHPGIAAPPQRGGLWQPLAYSQFMRRPPGQLPPNGALMQQHPATFAGSPPSGGNPPHMMPQQPSPSAIPGKPAKVPSAPAKPKGTLQEHVQYSRMRGKMLVEPIMRDRVLRRSTYDKRTIARDVLLATGRHPDMRGLNAHMGPMQKLLGDHGGQVDHEGRQNLKCDLSTIKWDIIDPGEPRAGRESAAAKTEVDDAESEKPIEEPTYDDARDAILSQRARSHKKAKKDPDGGDEATPKRRGRPRKSDYLMSNQDLGNAPASSPGPHAQSFTPIGGSTSTPTSSDALTMSGPVGYAAFNQIDANTGAKKKGRPFGWRKNVHSRAAQGLPPATLPRRETGPAAASSHNTSSKQSPAVEPDYQVYKCRWSDCSAQLHNLDTLKKHVVKLHGKPNDRDSYECSWRGCGEELNPIESWLEHVDGRHLQQVAWKLGDGPRGGSLSGT